MHASVSDTEHSSSKSNGVKLQFGNEVSILNVADQGGTRESALRVWRCPAESAPDAATSLGLNTFASYFTVIQDRESW